MQRILLAAGFPLVGFDLREERLAAVEAAGGRRAANCAELAKACSAIFVMVLNGAQVRDVVIGNDGLLAGLAPGKTVIVSATIMPAEVQALEAPLAEKGVPSDRHAGQRRKVGGRGRLPDADDRRQS